jgi:hypothetical protein
LRTVKTASGARAVQIVYSSQRGSRDIEHIGSAHDDAELEVLKALARQRLAAGQDELDLGLAGSQRSTSGGPLPITSSRMAHLCEALGHAYEVLGFEQATGADEVFRQLALARIIEPTSKLDALRVLAEVGVETSSTGRWRGVCPPTPSRRGGRGWRRRARRRRRWGRRPWCSTTCRRCISRPIKGMGSGSPGSPRNAGWIRRSPSGCSPTRPGSR